MVDQSSPVTTSKQQEVPVAQEDREAAREAAWHAIYGPGADLFENPAGYAFCSDVADAILASLPCKSGEGAGLPDDVRALVIAAREFWDDENSGTVNSHALDKALEPFSSRVQYNDEPTPSEQFAKSSPDAEQKWRERWYGSDPQKGSAIVTESGNLVCYLGGDEATHRLTTAIVAAHNATITSSPDADGSGGEAREAERAARALVQQLRAVIHRLDGQAYSSTLSQLNALDASLTRNSLAGAGKPIDATHSREAPIGGDA